MRRLFCVLLGCVIATSTTALAFAQEKKKVVAVPEKKPADDKSNQPKPDAKEAAEARKEAVQMVVEQVVVDDVDPNLAQFEQQYKQQFQQLVKGELLFIRTVCRPTKEQYEKIAAAGDQALKDTVKKFAEVQKKMMQGGVQAGQQSTFPDPRKLIAEALTKSVKATLSAEQAARYQDELDKRGANRKRVALLNLVAKLDHDLVLTAEQRDKLAASLSSQWNDAWTQSLEMFQHGDQYFPNIPDNLVLPILSEAQKGVWRSAAKNNSVFWGWAGLGFMGGVQVEDEVWEDAKPAEAQKSDQKPEEKK